MIFESTPYNRNSLRPLSRILNDLCVIEDSTFPKELKLVGLQNTSQGEMTPFTEVARGTLSYTGKSFNVTKANSRLLSMERKLLQFSLV
jgi:hypothetical protein